MVNNKDNEYSFDTTLYEREKYVKEVWEVYNSIISSVSHTGWGHLLTESFKPKMVPIQKVVRAPKFTSYIYTPPSNKVHYFVTDKSGNKIESHYLLRLPKTLY